jgi:hypothetical protein
VLLDRAGRKVQARGKLPVGQALGEQHQHVGADVQQLGRDGSPYGSVGFCSRGMTESLQQVNGGLVGYVPDDTVSNVRVTGPAGTVDATVSHRYFLLDPTIGPPGSTIEIVEYAGTRTIRTVTVTVARN